MFQLQNACGQLGRSFRTAHSGTCGNRGLDHHRAMVHDFIHKMHGTSGQAHAIRRGIGRAMGTGKTGQQRGVDVQNPMRKGAQEFRGQHAHEPGQGHCAALRRYAMLANDADHLCIKGLAAGKFRVRTAPSGYATAARAFQTVGLRLVGKHHADLRRQSAGVDFVENGLEVGTTAGNKHGQGKGHGHPGIKRVVTRRRRRIRSFV
jgi:hypothetical protein